MSRAFVRESDDAHQDPPRPRPQLAPGVKNHITSAGARRLRAELDDLLEQKSRLAPGAEGPTAADLDPRRHDLEARIRALQQILDSVVVTAPPAVGRDRICFGADVLVRHAGGQQEMYRIVGFDEADPERGQISWRSPLARALLSHRAGETIGFQTPSGLEELEIISVTYGE